MHIFPVSPSMCTQKTCALIKTAIYVKGMGVRTPHPIPWSVIATRRMQPPHEVPLVRLEESLAKTRIPRSPTCKYWLVWRNLRSLSRKPTQRTENISIMRKVPVILALSKAFGLVVPGKIHAIV